MSRNENTIAEPSQPPDTRFFGLDLIRSVVFLAIFIHHYNYWIFYLPTYPFPGVWYIDLAETFVRTLHFGGHYILFLTAFLIARSRQREKKSLMIGVFCVFAWLIFCFADIEDNHYFLTWDIHALIAISLVSGYWVAKRWGEKVVLVVGILLAALPSFVDLAPHLSNEYVRHIVIGVCEKDMGDWPLMPWFGFVWMSYAVGIFSRHAKVKALLAKAPNLWFHLFFVASLVAFAIITVPVLMGQEVGPHWSCLVMAPISIHTILAMVPFLCLVRYALAVPYNQKLSRWRFAKWNSQTAVNRYFGLFYVLHYPIISLWDHVLEAEDLGPFATAAAVVFLWLLTTLICHFLMRPYGRFFKTKHEFSS